MPASGSTHLLGLTSSVWKPCSSCLPAKRAGLRPAFSIHGAQHHSLSPCRGACCGALGRASPFDQARAPKQPGPQLCRCGPVAGTCRQEYECAVQEAKRLLGAAPV